MELGASVTTALGVGDWSTEDDRFFYVDYYGGGLTQRFERETLMCREASWYSYDTGGNLQFERCKLPFGLEWELERDELVRRLGAPSRSRGRLLWFDDLCEFEVRLMFGEDEALYSLEVDMDHVPTDLLELHRSSLMERVFDLFGRRVGQLLK